MSVQINVAANQAALISSIQAGVQAYNQRFANNNQINLNINARAFSQPLGRITGDVKDFEAALAASNARVIAFGASTAVLGGVIRSFKELASVTIDVEKNLADINRVFGLSTSQLQKFSTELFNVSKQTASTFDDASKAALEFSRQGLKAEETLQRTKDALTLTRLAGIGTANAVDALTSTVNGFANTGVTTTQILNKLIAVEQDFAVGAGDLAEALSRTGQAAQEAGVSLDQLNALVTSAQQSTARGGAVIGNALKTIFTRLQRTETLDQLEAFNISVRDVQGNILPAVTILQNFAGAYKNLADAQRAQLSEQVAGVYQVNILKAIVNDLNNSQGVYAGALQRGAMATNEAEIATAKLNKTLDALLKQTATSTQQLANNIGKVTFEPLARYGTEQLKSLVESMNEILEGEGIGSTFANGLLKGIRNILAGPGAIAAFFTLFKLIQNSFSFLTQALPQIAGITTETQNRKNIEQSILQIMQQQGPISQALAGTMGNQAAQAQLLLQLARQQTAEYQTQSALAKQLAVQLSGQGVKVAGARGLQVTRAGGYVPTATKLAEVVGAKAGGYSPGRVVPSPVGGVMNTAEDVKYIPGFAQPFINPPANSKAGRAHRQNAINRTGVDPYMNDGFIPNFAVKQFINDKGEVITGKKPNKTRDSYTLRLANYNPKNLKADEDLDLKRNLVDSGYWNDSVRDPKTGKIIHYHGERNNIYDTLSGNLKVVKYLNKDEVDKATKIAWDGLISGNTAWINDPNITKLGMDQSSVEAAFDRTKGKLGLTLEDFRFKKLASKNSSIAASNEKYRSLKTKTVYKTSEEFEKSLKGDFSNFIGDFYEQLVLKHQNISGAYQISAGNTDPADLVPKILGLTMYKGIEAKNTAARINDLIAKAIRINVAQMNQNTWDKSNDVDFGTLPIYQTIGPKATVSHNGFIPNFAIPVDSARIPWFKKYASSYKNIASDKDVFRQIDFPTYGKGLDHNYAKVGNADMVSFLYEDFVRSAINIALGSKQVVRSKEAGFKHTPTNAISNRDPIDLTQKISPSKFRMIEVKQSKNNQKETISQISDAKLRGLFQENPELAKNVELMSIIFNDPRFVDPTGKNPAGVLSPFEQSIAPIVKNSYADVDPVIKSKLSKITDGLLRRYEAKKNTNSKGFIPNFAYKQSVMSLEESMSGNKAIFDTKPFPHIRNSSQPTFSSAIADHGGLTNALSDSMRGQKAAGLMSNGFVPNFANSRSARRRIQRNQQQSSSGGSGFDPQQLAIQAEKLAKDALKKINNAYQYIAVFGADFADIIENTSKSATTKLKTSSTNVKTSVDNLYTNLKSSFSNMFSKGASSGGSKPPVMTSGPNVGILSKIGGGLSKTFANPILAMILPQITGAITSQFAYGDKKRYELTESERKKQSFANTGVTSISTGAFVGNMILPGWGAAIGAAVGGLIAFSEATKAAKLSVDEMKEKITENAAKQTNLINDYKNNLQNLTSATESGDTLIKDNITKDLTSVFAKLNSQNLGKNIEGKSIKELDILISEINKKATLQTTVLSASEKLSKGAKEVSFFDQFKQNAVEAILDFSNTVVGAFTVLGTSIYKIFNKVVEQIKDPFVSFFTYLKDTFTNFMDFLGSSFNMMMLGIESTISDIKDFFGFEDKQQKSDLDARIVAANEDLLNTTANLTNAISRSITKGFEISFAGLNFTQALLDKIGGAIETSGTRKIQQYNMRDVVGEYVGKAGGAGSSEFFKKIFNLGAGGKKGQLQDEKLYNLINTIGISSGNVDREKALEELRSILIDRNVAGDDIDTLLTSLREFSKTGNYKGQFILTNFQQFLSDLSGVDQVSARMADSLSKSVFNFTELKKSIERDINNYINQSKINEVSIAGGIQRQRASIEESARISEVFGKPFQAATYRAQSSRVDIEANYQKERRSQTENTFTMLSDLSQKVSESSLENLQRLQKAFEKENYTLEERISLLDQFVKLQQITFKDPNEKSNFIKQISTARTTAEISKKQNEEDKKTADYVYSLEIKRLQEARNFKLQLKSGLSSLSDEGDLMIGKLGRDLPGMFADGMVNGIKAAIRESDNLEDALMGVAANFLDSISTTLMQAGTRKILGSFGFENLFKSQKGGLIRAQSGMYISGTGSGDKYPALLENGEYVLNRRAVMAMGGPAALDTLNFSMAPRFASGGSFTSELTDIKAMEEGMTTFGLENSSYYKELRDAELQRAEEERRKRYARKVQRAQMIGSLVAAAATVAIGAGIKKFNEPSGYGSTTAGKLEAGVGNSPEMLKIVNGKAVMTGRQTGGLIGSRLSDTIPGYMEGGLYNSPMVKKYGTGMQSGGMSSIANNSNVVNNSNASNSFNFNTTVNRDGTIQMGANNTSYKQQDVELSENLNNRIYGAVLDVIRDQQRFGGSLAGTRKA